jgi:nitrite reductase (NADH) large subunit
LGVEAAHGLASLGARVTLLHLMPRLMELQLDARSAALLAVAMRRKGIEVVLKAQTAAIAGDGRAERVRLQDGRAYPAQLVVMAVGIRPATTLARTGGLQIGRGVKVDDGFATSVPGIYAIGECAEHRGTCCGLVEPAYAQAKALARLLAGMPAGYESGVMAAALKVSGVPVFSMGDFEGGGAGAETILLEDQGAALYRKLIVRDGRLAGAVLFGDTAEALWYRDLIRQQAPIAPIRSSLAFGRAYAEAA